MKQLIPENAVSVYKCECNQIFNSRTTLWRHKKKCALQEEVLNKKEKEEVGVGVEEENKEEMQKIDMNIIFAFMKDTQEFKQMMMDQNKTMMELAGKMGNTINTNTNTNSHNNTQFNLQFFLNETCKDAMNVTQFLDFIKVELEDLDYTGKAGYIEGVTRIFTKNLDRLGKFEKPFWTTDEKRETIMSKENGVWEKDEQHKQMNKVITKIEGKNLMQLSPWKEAHPGWQNSDKLGEFLAKIQKNIMGGEPTMECGYPDETKSNEKIVRNIIKKTIVPKK
jgi:hypothetical protein